VLNDVSLRVRLALLVAGTTLPLILFAGGLVYVHHVQDRERAYDRVLDNVRSVRLTLDSEVQSITAGLQVLALSQALARDDFKEFRVLVDTFLTRFPDGANISLADEAGNQLVNSAQRKEGPLPPVKRETLAQVFETGGPAYSNLFYGSVSGDPIIVIDVPVYRNGKVVYALSMNPPLSIFQRLIEQERFGPEWTIAIFDRTGTNFARVPNPERTVGQKASPSLLTEMFKQDEAKIRTTTLEGVNLITAYTRSPVSQWTVAGGIAEATITAPVWRTLALTAAIGGVLLVIGVAFAIRLARDVARGEALQALMVNELNHRVKNTLATVQSISAQTFRDTSSFADARDKFEARLIALGRAHNILSEERWLDADLQEIVNGILVPLGFKDSERVKLIGPAIRVPPRAALMLSMVLHELATNAVKYGALSGPSGRLSVDWDLHGEGKDARVDLIWREAGGPAVLPPKRKGFGSRMIEQSMSAQLGGKADLAFAPEGVVCRLEFPLV
jgi:two-component sensor histidine kinase